MDKKHLDGLTEVLPVLLGKNIALELAVRLASPPRAHNLWFELDPFYDGPALGASRHRVRVCNQIGRQVARQRFVDAEMKAAQEIQPVLVPAAAERQAPGYAVSSVYRPASEVGGDFFQIIPLGDGDTHGHGTLIVAGDVSGKGLRAAMTVSLVVSSARSPNTTLTRRRARRAEPPPAQAPPVRANRSAKTTPIAGYSSAARWF